MKDKTVLALMLVLVLLAGVGFGFALRGKYDAADRVLPRDFGAATSSGRTSAERVPGAEAADENSLRAYMALLDNLRSRDASESVRQIYAEDKALSLMRLADLAEKRGSSAESTRLTSDALAVCAIAGLPYCSSVELRQRAQKMDMILQGAAPPK